MINWFGQICNTQRKTRGKIEVQISINFFELNPLPSSQNPCLIFPIHTAKNLIA